MSLQPGTTLGHYEILSAIGKGGMGEVYRARDRTLGREVAIKVLPEDLSRDPERLSRFEREARLLAALNHPAIATLHGLETFEETPFLVMELVEGETLAERIARGPMPLDEVVELFRQVAEGLEAAHEKGIVHRDLKPANLKIRPDGSVKILDFGLAKPLVEGDDESSDPSHSPTLTKGTAFGAILGTASYMSPEQARGRLIDKRTDVWAFGCVLYQCLTGKKAFDGETVTDILARVVQGTVDLEALPETTPPWMRRLIRRCIEKDRRLRLRDIGEAWYALTEEREEAPSAARARTPHARYALLAGSALLAGFLARVAFEPAPERPELFPARYTLSLDRPLTDLADLAFAVSPRGDAVVYAGASGEGTQRLYLRNLADGIEREFPGTEDASAPFFSPNGEWVGFFARGSLQKVSLRGGNPVRICESGFAWGASWGPDDVIAFVLARNEILSVSANGGVPKEVIRSDEASYRWPSHLPDGKTLLVERGRGRMALVSLETGDEKEITAGLEGRVPRYSPTGHVLFVSSNSLFAAEFDARAEELTGDPVPVLDGLRQVGATANFALAANGSLYYVPGRDTLTSEKFLVWLDRRGELEPVTSQRRAFFMPRLSPAENAIATTVWEGVRHDVWIYELETDAFRRLTTEGASCCSEWSPNGDRIAYTFMPRDAKMEIRVIPVDGSGEPEVLVVAAEDRGLFADAWTLDGRTLLYSEQRTSTDYDIWSVAVDGSRSPDLVAGTEFYESEAAFSRDGDWVAFTSEAMGHAEIYLRPFPGPGPERQVSQGGGRVPRWLSSGELIYVARNRVISVPIETSPSLVIGRATTLLAPDVVLDLNGQRQYDPTIDGERLLSVQGQDRATTSELAVIVNFSDQLRRLAPER